MIKRFIKKYYIFFIITVFISAASYFLLAVSNNLRVDSDSMIHYPVEMRNIFLSSGRFGFYFLKGLLGLTVYNNVKSAILFLIFFNIAAILLVFFFYIFSGENTKYPYYIFLFLFASSPIWSAQLYFILQEAEIALALILITLSAGLVFFYSFYKRRLVFLPIITLALNVVCFATYQSFVVYYMTLCVCFFLIMLKRGEKCDNRKYITGLIIIILHFIVSLIVYYGVVHVFFNTSSYLSNYIMWSKLPVTVCVKYIIKSVIYAFICFGEGNISVFTLAFILSVIALFCTFRSEKRKDYRIWLVLSLLAAFILPFSFNIIFGFAHKARIQFSLQVISPFLIMLFFPELKEKSKKIVTFICIVFSVFQIGINVMLLHTDNIRYAHDHELATAIMADIGAECEEKGLGINEYPIVFLGIRSYDDNLFTLKESEFGNSYFEWGGDGEPDINTTAIRQFIIYDLGYDFPVFPDELKGLAYVDGKDMPSYPEDGYINVKNGYIVVKLSDYKFDF